MSIFVYDRALRRGLGGVEGLAEVVGDEGTDGAVTADMGAHWPVLRVSRVGRAGVCLKRD